MAEEEYSMQFITGGDKKTSFSKTPAQTPKGFENEKPPSPAPRGTPSTNAKKRKTNANTGATAASKKSKATTSTPKKSVEFAASSPEAAEAGALAIPVRQKQTRKAKGKAASSRPTPRSYEECEEADKALLDMRDDKKDWKEIRAEWKRLTGEPAAASTLPNRYARLKSNFTVIKEEDNALLIIAKREVEDSFEAQKWQLIATLLKNKGGDDYPPIVLRRQYKKLMVGAGAVVPEGIEDKDFQLPELGSEDERLGIEDDLEAE